MSTNVFNQVPFLRTSREFPEDLEQLVIEINKTYIDIANVVNARTIGLYALNRPVITGESYYLTGNRLQQTLRQTFQFTSTASITHGISVTVPGQFTECYGSYTDGSSSFGIIWGTSGASIPGQISFYITSTQIVFEVDVAAPALSSGRITLTWLSNP